MEIRKSVEKGNNLVEYIMYFTTYYLQKSDGTIDRNIFAYNIYMKAIQKYREITANYKYISSDYFRCFVLDDEGDCLNNNLEK